MTNCELITIQEAAKRLRVNDRRVRYLLELGELQDNGKTGKARRVKWQLDGEGEESGESLEAAKRRKMVADADLAEIKGEARANELRREGALQYLDRVMEVLAVLPQAYAAAKLNSEQSAAIREAYETVLKGANELRNLA